jgi:hypothetical protein
MNIEGVTAEYLREKLSLDAGTFLGGASNSKAPVYDRDGDLVGYVDLDEVRDLLT